MNNPEVSIIVPVYNVEKYLPRCIDSILAQTSTNFELILIDDGSTDKSGMICDEYAKKDNRIKVFHKENGGVSSARNIGLDNASGEWLAFIDPDDAVDKEYLSLPELCKADVIEKSFIVYDEKNNIIQHIQVTNDFINSQEDFFRAYVNKRNNALWNKIIRRSITQNCHFDVNVKIGEDFLFFLSFITKVKSYKYVQTGTYLHYMRNTSAMGQIKFQPQLRIQQLWDNIGYVENMLQDKNLNYLKHGVIYNGNVFDVLAYSKLMSKNDIKKLRRLFADMNWDKLKYIKLKAKIRLFIIKAVFSNNILLKCKDYLRIRSRINTIKKKIARK